MEAYPRITLKILLQFKPLTIAIVLLLGLITWAFSVSFHFENPTYLFPSLTVYGTVLSLFLAFRTNEAYNRWWEARTLWGGMVNYSRTLARQVITLITLNQTKLVSNQAELKELHRELIMRHLAFVNALRINLRNQDSWDQLEPFIDSQEMEKYKKSANIPTQIIQKQGERIRDLFDLQTAKDYRQMQFDRTLTELYNIQGSCERIKTTVFPQLYGYFTMAFTWLFASVLITSLADEFDWQTLIMRSAVAYVFVTLDQLGRAMTNPFENKPQDIPMSSLCRTIEIDLKQQLGESEIPPPLEPVKGVVY